MSIIRYCDLYVMRVRYRIGKGRNKRPMGRDGNRQYCGSMKMYHYGLWKCIWIKIRITNFHQVTLKTVHSETFQSEMLWLGHLERGSIFLLFAQSSAYFETF